LFGPGKLYRLFLHPPLVQTLIYLQQPRMTLCLKCWNILVITLIRYKEEKLLGEGGFSKVYAGECRSTSTPVAIKHISKEDVEYVKVNCQGNVYNEILEVFLLDQAAGRLCDGSFKNPAVIGLMDVFHLETEVIIVMERLPDTVDGIDYLYEVNHIPEDKIKVIFTQIINAALLMHKNGVFHRDLKLENILVNRNKGNPEIRVIDFGCGDFVQNEPFLDFCGTVEFAPPEHIRGETYKAEAMTVWQIGAMLHMTCTRVCFETLVYIKKDKEVLKNVSKECNDFLSQFTQTDLAFTNRPERIMKSFNMLTGLSDHNFIMVSKNEMTTGCY
uniref:Serine/threonine-protein kinase 1 n=1 Tax=Gouania willdenowi TaxID=441366 RepID=A0A8C5DWG5_GOUWI